MRALELKVPPPVVTLITAGAMWGVSRLDASLSLPADVRVDAALITGVVGLAVMLAAVWSFRRDQTTINPMRPQESSKLVSTGVFALTRNPMYLGMTLLLVAWAAYLATAWALLGPVLFVAYITRFQILPEERALSGLFGSSFAAYMARVRRWL
ncbi:MAG TPA: isoprenylcysteine carboxylmethyltransferase family protein [Candidatus Binatia bacterium]|nr:isoprenylcysteine carboxylmethyltransferase family protein [Candidatus Binatia bacterium]